MRMDNRRALLAITSIVAVAFSTMVTATATADQAKGSVDWEKKVITATGMGAPNLRAPNIAVARLGAERAAKMDALRNILETLKGVTVTSGSTAGGIMDSDSAIKARVSDVLKGFKVVDKRYFSDGAVEVDVEMKLDGALASAFMPEGERKTVPTGGEKKYTGLIVDATGHKTEPALAPRIIDDAGTAIYGAEYVAPDAVKKRGVVAYGKSLADAKKNPRVGDNPLVIKAVKTEGSDLVIAKADADALLKNNDLSFLADGRVLVVTD